MTWFILSTLDKKASNHQTLGRRQTITHHSSEKISIHHNQSHSLLSYLKTTSLESYSTVREQKFPLHVTPKLGLK